MTLEKLLDKLVTQPETIVFDEVMQLIDNYYDFKPTAFSNGTVSNEARQNNGSCKVFYFAKLHQLSHEQTLHCFGQYYQDVLNSPAEEDHQNIRAFMVTGMSSVRFAGVALIKEQP